MTDKPTTAPLFSLESGETCAYLKPDSVTGCRAPRSCRSCLTVAGCLIGKTGTCVSEGDEAIDSDITFDHAIARGFVLPNDSVDASQPQAWQFPAGRVEYCSPSDTVCRVCRRAYFWRSRQAPPDSRFCLGENQACVCIDVCERPRTTEADCSAMGITGASAPTPVPTLGTGDTTQAVWHAMVGAAIFGFVALGLLLRVRCVAESARRDVERRRQGTQRHRQSSRAQALGIDPLNLSGWEKYRRDLIDKETAQLELGAPGNLQGGDNVETSTPYVQASEGDRPSVVSTGTNNGRTTVLAPLLTVQTPPVT